MKTLILMLQFLTKLPLPFTIKADQEDFQRGIVYFPLVGGVIGCLLLGVYWGSQVFFSPLVVAGLVVAFSIFITGGLHLDGLADTFDGLYSYRDREKMLEIMKDSRVGTNGVLVLIVVILLKVFLVYEVIHRELGLALVLMPVYGRMMGVFLARIGVYARNKGMGGFFIGHTKNGHLMMGLVFTGILSCVYLKSLVLLPLMAALTLAYNYHVKSKINGITGDVLGAWIELSEVIFLMGVLVL